MVGGSVRVCVHSLQAMISSGSVTSNSCQLTVKIIGVFTGEIFTLHLLLFLALSACSQVEGLVGDWEETH